MYFKKRNKINFIFFILFYLLISSDFINAYSNIINENNSNNKKNRNNNLNDNDKIRNDIFKDLSLIISTVDGGLYSFDYETGSLNWNINPNDGDSLYTTSQFSNNNKNNNNNEEVEKATSTSLLIPTIDGSGALFQYSEEGSLQKVPFSLHELISTSPLFLKDLSSAKDDTMLIGNKQTSITVVDSTTGQVIKSMSKEGLWEEDCPVNIPDEALMFTRSDYKVIALDPKSGLEKWNLSIGEYIPYSTKATFNADSLSFEGSIEVSPASHHRYKITVRQQRTVVGTSNIFWEFVLSSSPVSVYAFSNRGGILKKLEFSRKTSHPSSLQPINTNTDLIIPSSFERTFLFDDFNGQFFIERFLISDGNKPNNNNNNNNHNNNNNNRNNQIISNNENYRNKDDKNQNNIFSYDIYLYSSIIILITSVIIFIRSKHNFNLINLNSNNTNNNKSSKKTPKKKKKQQQQQQQQQQQKLLEEIEEENEENNLIQQLQLNNSNSNNFNYNKRVVLENGNLKIGKLEIATNKVLGTGSCGTIVYQGFMEGRVVAVKRMLSQFIKFADREVSILIQSDEHTNVVRYYAKEEDDEFIYLAISYCQGSLDQYVQQKLFPADSVPATTNNNNGINNSPSLQSISPTIIILDQKIKNMIYELFKGLEHLHSLNIVHRDIKPQNILIDPNNRIKISDMGLGKALDRDEASLTFTSDSHGWQPAEYLNGTNRNTKKVDIFSIGCVVYYLLTGTHPFGQRFNREKNVLKGKFDIELIADKPDLHQLIQSMIQFNPDKRPSIIECLNHPFFWESHKKLSFLVAASDYLEFEKPTSPLNVEIDSHIDLVTDGDGDWWLKFDQVLIDNIGRYRKYNGKSIRDLLRVIRNKFNHYRDLSLDEQNCLGSLPDGFLNYFESKYPKLFITTFLFVSKNLKTDQYFLQYF
ncbi:hypothetical protein DICPUDRAFT_58819 [Dictyostelium purpureum]|uniref:non-specific serine/threonine protein kinase n=1 Tax=Dictyostelium purpureum TaxID=5786 RepID=F1A327_DICPU|nr:uncharacterized protein DICPUDRAFT_58819 [Dictyostelium purpureum]EGC29399.1 hypothetical protein DICPUDRAFT_58819 [Dictyostelium purpureum]|eukprot:XP_003294070.1 hypothetical protein DICPUDRAFT_58819 [Dictyostelium purpureum]